MNKIEAIGSILVAALAGCSSFDGGDAIDLASTLHATTWFGPLTASQRCVGGGSFGLVGTALTLTRCNGNGGGGSFTTSTPLATIVRTSASPTGTQARITHVSGSISYHLEGVSIGTEGTCDVAMTITTVSVPDVGATTATEWTARGLVCDQDVEYGCHEGMDFYCFE